MLITQALGLAAALLITLEWGYFGEGIGHKSLHFVYMSLYVGCLLPLALAADEHVRRGARPLAVYTVLLLLNPVIGCVLAFITSRLYCLGFGVQLPDTIDARWGWLDTGVHISVVCSLGLLVFMNQRITDRMLEGVRGIELRRVQLDRQLVESRLATAEAQIDPQKLIDDLGKVKRGFEGSAPDAERQLDELIQTLRNALGRTRQVSGEENEP